MIDNLIVKSLGDTDMYKFSMGNCVWQNYPDATATYEFVCRGHEKLGFLAEPLKRQVQMIRERPHGLREHEFLMGLGWLDREYLAYMCNDFDYSTTKVDISDRDGELHIVARGRWIDAMMWEIPILATVNELWFDSMKSKVGDFGTTRLREKMAFFRQYPRFQFADFGTRRRFSAEWQESVVSTLATQMQGQFIGTSNVGLACKLGLKPIGTMAHEFISAHLALCPRIEVAQSKALYTWLQTYKTNLGIALSDTFTSEAFFRGFDIVLSKAFSGVRQDSGDPFSFAKRAIEHYESMGIDPRTKTIVFSDSLTPERAIDIWKQFVGRIGVSFGIGTNLTNDMGVKPLSIVMKMIECNGKPVCKISDDGGKAISGSPGVMRDVISAYKIKG